MTPQAVKPDTDAPEQEAAPPGMVTVTCFDADGLVMDRTRADGGKSKLFEADPLRGNPVILLSSGALSTKERRHLVEQGLQVFRGREFRILRDAVQRVHVAACADERRATTYEIRPLPARTVIQRGPAGTDWEMQPFPARVTFSNPWMPEVVMVQATDVMPWDGEDGREMVIRMARAALGDLHMCLCGADLRFARAVRVEATAPPRFTRKAAGRRR